VFDWVGGVLEWLELHPGLAGWMAAIGATLAVVAAILVGYLQRRSERIVRETERRLRAQGLAILLHAETVEFAQYIRWIVSEKDMLAASHMEPPTTLTSRLEELYLLGPPGGALLQLVSGIRVTRLIASRSIEASADHGINDFELWPPINTGLKIAIANADDAVAGMTKIISDGAARVARMQQRRWFSRPGKAKNGKAAKTTGARREKPSGP
jgi:hypothetical protein